MKQIITILFLFCAFTVNAQDVIVTGPNKKQQTAKQTTHSINATNKQKAEEQRRKEQAEREERVRQERIRQEQKIRAEREKEEQERRNALRWDESKKALFFNGNTYEMIYVSKGSFTMGATSEQAKDEDKFNIKDEKPTHTVTLSNYYIGKFEVTQELWMAVMGKNPSVHSGNKKPVENVSWNDCQTFIAKLNSITGKYFRLPTEAEWEFAARGGVKSRGYKYSGSNNINDIAWCGGRGASTSSTHEVGTKRPNELGIHDMSGNVNEWCSDWYGNYSRGAQSNPVGPTWGDGYVYRGGDFYNSAIYCRSSSRDRNNPDYRWGQLGLRLALSE